MMERVEALQSELEQAQQEINELRGGK
jgi:hypothetical protein